MDYLGESSQGSFYEGGGKIGVGGREVGDMTPTSGSRDWSDVARSQGMPEASRTWKKQGTDLRLEPVGRNSPANTLILVPSDSFYTLHLSENITHAHLIFFVDSAALGTIF